jgi:hypothetical protein
MGDTGTHDALVFKQDQVDLLIQNTDALRQKFLDSPGFAIRAALDVGDPVLAAALAKFALAWNLKRQNLIDSLAASSQALRLASEKFEVVDANAGRAASSDAGPS